MSLPRVCVCYLIAEGADGPRVLLGTKRTGLGLGKVVAPGGKLEAGESPAQAMVREIAEETGLVVAEADLEPAGRLRYRFPHREAWSQESHVFRARRWRGEARDSEELSLGWVPLAEVPLDRMWDDARLWLPGVLAGGSVALDVDFAADNDTVAAAEVSR